MQQITNSFNAYFSKIGENLAAKIKQGTGSHLDTISPHYNVTDSLFLTPTTVPEILNIVRELKMTKSSGYDHYSARVIKSVICLFI